MKVETFKTGDKVYYGSWSRIKNPKGQFIIARGIIRAVSKGFAMIERTDYSMPLQLIDLTRLKKEKE